MSGGPDPVAQLSSMHLVSAAEVDEVRSAELEKKRKQHDIREPLQRKIRKREPDDVVPVQSVDAILLSFFDGVGTAGLVFQQMCNERSWRGRVLLWESESDLVALTSAHFPEADGRPKVRRAVGVVQGQILQSECRTPPPTTTSRRLCSWRDL